MNVLIGVLLLISSIYFSYLLSDKFVKRKVFYSDYLEFNNKIINEVFFNQETLTKITKQLKFKNSDFNCLVANNDLSSIKKITYLIDEEKDYFEKYLNNLGMSDKDSQLNFLKQVNSYLDSKYKKCIDEENKNRRLYIKLGILLGLVLMVICL